MRQNSAFRMPSLIALRAFEALVRQGSISRAALELHVTHGAVSHQVKKLEEELGMALVERQGPLLREASAPGPAITPTLALMASGPFGAE